MRNLSFFCHHTSLSSYSHQCTDCIKHIYKQESKHYYYHFFSKYMFPLEFKENRLNRRRSTYNAVNMCQSHWNTNNCSQQNTKKQSSAYTLHQQDRCNQQADNSQQSRTRSYISQRNKSRIIIHNDTSILQTQKSNKQTNTCTNRILQCSRQGINDLFTQVGNCQQDEDNTLQQNGSQCKLP